MLSRILSGALAATWVAAATPAYAYDPSDPAGPPPDDPSAWTSEPGPARVAYERSDPVSPPPDDPSAWSLESSPPRVAQSLKRCDMMFAVGISTLTPDDPTAFAERGIDECSCKLKACGPAKGSPRAEGKARQGDARVDGVADSPG